MTSNYHTPLGADAPLKAETINPPLGQLDEAIGRFRAGEFDFTGFRFGIGPDLIVVPGSPDENTLRVTHSLHRVKLSNTLIGPFNNVRLGGHINQIEGGYDGMLLTLSFEADMLREHFVLTTAGSLSNIRLNRTDAPNVRRAIRVVFSEILQFFRWNGIWTLVSDYFESPYSGRLLGVREGMTALLQPHNGTWLSDDAVFTVSAGTLGFVHNGNQVWTSWTTPAATQGTIGIQPQGGHFLNTSQPVYVYLQFYMAGNIFDTLSITGIDTGGVFAINGQWQNIYLQDGVTTASFTADTIYSMHIIFFRNWLHVILESNSYPNQVASSIFRLTFPDFDPRSLFGLRIDRGSMEASSRTMAISRIYLSRVEPL